MFRFSPPRRAHMAESVVPMINVVFLLLIFFLMTAQLQAPAAVEVVLPESEQGKELPEAVELFVSKSGEIVGGGLVGQAALALVTEGAEITVRADARLPGTVLAKLVRDLGARGAISIKLAVVSR